MDQKTGVINAPLIFGGIALAMLGGLGATAGVAWAVSNGDEAAPPAATAPAKPGPSCGSGASDAGGAEPSDGGGAIRPSDGGGEHKAPGLCSPGEKPDRHEGSLPNDGGGDDQTHRWDRMKDEKPGAPHEQWRDKGHEHAKKDAHAGAQGKHSPAPSAESKESTQTDSHPSPAPHSGAPAGAKWETDSAGRQFYVIYVTDADTLSGISKRTGVSVDELAQYNKIRNVDLIYTGSALRIPR